MFLCQCSGFSTFFCCFSLDFCCFLFGFLFFLFPFFWGSAFAFLCLVRRGACHSLDAYDFFNPRALRQLLMAAAARQTFSQLGPPPLVLWSGCCSGCGRVALANVLSAALRMLGHKATKFEERAATLFALNLWDTGPFSLSSSGRSFGMMVSKHWALVLKRSQPSCLVISCASLKVVKKFQPCVDRLYCR